MPVSQSQADLKLVPDHVSESGTEAVEQKSNVPENDSFPFRSIILLPISIEVKNAAGRLEDEAWASQIRACPDEDQLSMVKITD